MMILQDLESADTEKSSSESLHYVLIDLEQAILADRLVNWLNCFIEYVNGLTQNCSNSNALALEILQSCTKKSI